MKNRTILLILLGLGVLVFVYMRGRRVVPVGVTLPGDEIQEKLLLYARLYDLDPDLVKALAWQESRFDPNAINMDEGNGSSSWGLMQIWYPNTASLMGFNGAPEGLLDIDVNLDLACRLLVDIYSRYNGLADVIASYNAGSPKFAPGGDYINQVYVDSVLNRYNFYQAGGADV